MLGFNSQIRSRERRLRQNLSPAVVCRSAGSSELLSLSSSSSSRPYAAFFSGFFFLRYSAAKVEDSGAGGLAEAVGSAVVGASAALVGAVLAAAGPAAVGSARGTNDSRTQD